MEQQPKPNNQVYYYAAVGGVVILVLGAVMYFSGPGGGDERDRGTEWECNGPISCMIAAGGNVDIQEEYDRTKKSAKAKEEELRKQIEDEMKKKYGKDFEITDAKFECGKEGQAATLYKRWAGKEKDDLCLATTGMTFTGKDGKKITKKIVDQEQIMTERALKGALSGETKQFGTLGGAGPVMARVAMTGATVIQDIKNLLGGFFD